MDIAAWLREIGLQQYERAFLDNAIDVDVLPQVTDEHLKELGLSLAHRLTFLKAVDALRRSENGDAAASSGTPTVDGERRHVAVMFADLVGYTELSSRVDEEDVHALLEAFFECVDEIVERYGGRVDKHIGDCVMAVFGAPTAYGDDAERAVRSAVAVRDAMPGLSARVGRLVRVHIGISGGLAVASGTGSARHRRYTVTGDTVNLAARLTDAAEPGEILLSERLWGSLPVRPDGEDAGWFAVKGYGAPVRAWRLAGLRTAAAGVRSPFVGRSAELCRLEAILAACKEGGRGRAVCLRGEAGIGKTRLLEEVQDLARKAGFACHTALVLDFGTGRDAVRSLVRALLHLDSSSDTEAVGRVARDALAGGMVPADSAVFLYDLLDLPQPAGLRGVYAAMERAAREHGRRGTVSRLIDAASRRQPRLLAVEDLHWAEPSILEHLAELALAVADCQAVLIMTSRPEGALLDTARSGRTGGASIATIDLDPLRKQEALALAGALFGPADRTVERCVERASGNPLFLEQLLRHAVEISDSGVPGSVHSLVQARVDRLAREDKQALQAASVLGQRFDPEALAHMLERPGYRPDPLVDRLLVRPHGEAFLFAHALIRDAVYESLLKSRLRRLHCRAAEWFAGRDPVLHAEHLDRAGEPAAARAYLAAARALAVEYRHEPALRLLERALELESLRAERFEIACFRGDLLHDLGRMSDSDRAYGEALAVAETPLERCRARIGLAAVKRMTDHLDDALNDLEHAETEAVAHSLTAERARIHSLRGNLLFPRGDIEGCLREHTRSLEMARQSGAVELEAAALGGLGDAEYMRGRMISADAHFRRCIELAVERGLGHLEVANRPMAAITRWYAEGSSAALLEARAGLAAAARVRHRRAEMIAHHAAYFCLYAMGDLARAGEHVERALALARELGAPRFEAEALAFRANLLRMAGRRADALRDAGEALAIGRRTGMAYAGPTILGIFALATDDGRIRDDALAEGRALLAAGSVSHNHLFFGWDAVEVCLGIGDWNGAEVYAAAIDDYVRSEPLPWAAYMTARGRALAAWGRGRRDETLLAELRRLRREGEALGLQITLQRIDAALA